MKPRYLGRTGVKVSPFGLGTMNFGPRTPKEEAVNIIHAAVANGINLINTADMDYSGTSEQIVGEAIKSIGARDSIFWSTEISGEDMGVPDEPNLSRKYIIQACERSLKRFGTDYIDLYNIPRPNLQIPIDETLRALTDLIQQGKVRYVGTSTFPAWMVLEAITVGERLGLCRIVTEQPPYNLLDRRIENELVPFAQRYDLALIPWAPLAQGVLAGRYTTAGQLPSDSRAATIGGIYEKRVTARGIEIGHKLRDLAKRSGKTPAQFAYLWVRDQPAVTAPIVGIRTISQLDELVEVFDDRLTEEERQLCDQLNPPGSVVTSFFNSAPWMKMHVPDVDV